MAEATTIGAHFQQRAEYDLGQSMTSLQQRR
jgi:hypothetical protein